MKMVEALIPPALLEATKAALADEEIYRMTVTDVQSLQPGGEVQRMVKVAIGVNEAFLDPTIRAIQQAAGDSPCSIIVLPLADVTRVRTGETGGDAI
jgi:nitrogen regulatory protein PII